MLPVWFLVDFPAGISVLDGSLHGPVYAEGLQRPRVVLWRAGAFLNFLGEPVVFLYVPMQTGGVHCRNIATDATAQSDLQAEVARLNRIAESYKVFPVITLSWISFLSGPKQDSSLSAGGPVLPSAHVRSTPSYG